MHSNQLFTRLLWKHRIFPLSSAWTIQKGGGMPVFRVGGLCCFIGYWNWDAGWLYAWPLSFSSTSELGSLSTLIPSLAAAFHSLPPSLKTQPSQLPQAIEGQSGAFKGTVTAAIILLSHGKTFFPYSPSLGGSVHIVPSHHHYSLCTTDWLMLCLLDEGWRHFSCFWA